MVCNSRSSFLELLPFVIPLLEQTYLFNISLPISPTIVIFLFNTVNRYTRPFFFFNGYFSDIAIAPPLLPLLLFRPNSNVHNQQNFPNPILSHYSIQIAFFVLLLPFYFVHAYTVVALEMDRGRILVIFHNPLISKKK